MFALDAVDVFLTSSSCLRGISDSMSHVSSVSFAISSWTVKSLVSLVKARSTAGMTTTGESLILKNKFSN